MTSNDFPDCFYRTVVKGLYVKDGTIDTREIKAKVGNARGGIKYTLHPGDILFIPAGVPHAHRTIGTARLYITKIPQPEVPLEGVPGWK